VHRDVRPSLAVDQRGSNILIKCFAGCRTRDLLETLGLTWADLHDGPLDVKAESIPPVIVGTYEYSGVDASTYARKVRIFPKRFIWERWDSGVVPPRWRRRLDGVSPGLYGIEQVPETKQVFIVEGKKAADLLRAHGLVTVAPPVGASVWTERWTESLWRAGACQVIVLPDADQPGRLHGAKVAATCFHWRPILPETEIDGPWPEVSLPLQPGDPEAAPLTVKVVELPGLHLGEDVYDWLNSHAHSTAELLRLVTTAEPWTPPDPVARRRELTRIRVQRLRQRRREAADSERDVRRVRSEREAPDKKTSCRDTDLSLRYALHGSEAGV
jgi:hypothetical protein